MRDRTLFPHVLVEDIGSYFVRYISVLVRIYPLSVQNLSLKSFFRTSTLQIFDEISANFGCFPAFRHILIYRNPYFLYFLLNRHLAVFLIESGVFHFKHLII